MKEEEKKKGHWIIDVITIAVVGYSIYWAVKAFMI